VLADLDRFKELNDRCGHPAGDDALVAVARTLDGGCRSIDTVARIGGEEFALLLPATSPSGAFEVAERLRAEIARTAAADGRALTISFGIVACSGAQTAQEGLMRAADAALYRAKAAGRDRTVVDADAALVQ
jgi:diguanylate cyclase (GGDEF)-like protein